MSFRRSAGGAGRKSAASSFARMNRSSGERGQLVSRTGGTGRATGGWKAQWFFCCSVLAGWGAGDAAALGVAADSDESCPDAALSHAQRTTLAKTRKPWKMRGDIRRDVHRPKEVNGLQPILCDVRGRG